MRVTYYAASSLDGFIADADGSVGWLDELGIAPEASGFDNFFASVDGIVMGRATWEQVLGFGDWPYADKPVWVCTRRSLTPPAGIALQTARDPRAVVVEAKAMGITHLWLVGGGSLAAGFLSVGLLTHVSISVMPVVLGTGIPLFGEVTKVHLTPEKMTPMEGFCQLEYRIAASNPRPQEKL